MKKLLLLVVSVVMLAGWRSFNGTSNGKRADLVSPKDVAEDFAKAIVQRDPDKALEFYDAFEESGGRFVLRPRKQRDNLKKKLEDLGHELNAEKLECEAILEDIMVPPEFYGYHLVNGRKYTGETARVLLQFMKGDVKKSDGLEIALVKVDDSWKVAGYELKSGLDTSSEDSDREYKDRGKVDKPKSGNFDRDDTQPVDRGSAYEALCREYASLLKRKGQEIPEEAIEEEVKKFRGYSREKQEEELEKAEMQLKKMKRASRDEKKEESKPSASKYGGKDASEYERVRKFERLCEEAASLMDLSREDVEKEVKRFKNASEEEQKEALAMAENALKEMRRNADKKAEAKKEK